MNVPGPDYERAAHDLCRAVEADMRRRGVVTTAHYEAGVPLIAAAIRDAVLAEREACAALARDCQRRHDGRCPPECRCADGHHVAAAIRARGREGTTP